MDTPSSHGRRFWRSLEERLDSEEFRRMMRRDHPEQAESWLDPVTRRRFLAFLGASLGLAGLAGCGSSHPPREKIVPYVMPPEQLVAGHSPVLRHLHEPGRHGRRPARREPRRPADQDRG